MENDPARVNGRRRRARALRRHMPLRLGDARVFCKHKGLSLIIGRQCRSYAVPAPG